MINFRFFGIYSLLFVSLIGFSQEYKVRVNEPTYLYSTPKRATAKKLSQLNAGEIIDYLGYSPKKKFYQVQISDLEGFISRRKASLVKKVESMEESLDYQQDFDSGSEAMEEDYNEDNIFDREFEEEEAKGPILDYNQRPFSFEFGGFYGNINAKRAFEETGSLYGFKLGLYYDLFRSRRDRVELGFNFSMKWLEFEDFLDDLSSTLEVENSIKLDAGLSLRYLFVFNRINIGPEAGFFYSVPSVRVVVPLADAPGVEAVEVPYNKGTIGYFVGGSLWYSFNQSWYGGVGVKYVINPLEDPWTGEIQMLGSLNLGIRF